MKLIVGLGNPGKSYLTSRHNAGFLVVESLACVFKTALKLSFFSGYKSARAKIQNNEVILAQPVTFMNLSGRAVKALLKKHKIDLSDLLVICDDLDLEFGKVRIRKSGSFGGHRGLESIIKSLGGDNFARLRVGIGRPRESQEAAEYVLSAFNKQEKDSLPEIIKKASDCCVSWISEGIEKTMNKFNQKE